MMQQADRQRLTHIYEYCVSIENAIGRFGNGFEAFDSDEDFQHALSFCLLQIGELGGGLSCESYGVKVAGPDGEEASVPNITVSVERIDQLLELLRRNCVSPVTLRDVVLDWL